MMAAEPRKVLITGAGGFIGRALRKYFAKRGVAHVAVLRELLPADIGLPECIALGDFAAADWDAPLAGVDTIVHLAGRAHVLRERGADATPYVVANVHVTRRLLEAAARASVKRVVLASTVKVYGEATQPGQPFRAGDRARPRGAYAHSKAEAENVLWQICHANGIEGVVLRLPLVYGPGVKGNFLILLEAIAAGRRLPLAGAANRRSLLYVGNVVSAIDAALRAPALADETLPITDTESVSTAQLIQKIARGLGVRARLYRVPAPLLRAGAALSGPRGAAARLLDSLEVDATRFGELAQWTPPTTLDEGLAATAAWWRLRHAL
jgi:nucleoside-diphosphate-sugar epimerase